MVAAKEVSECREVGLEEGGDCGDGEDEDADGVFVVVFV